MPRSLLALLSLALLASCSSSTAPARELPDFAVGPVGSPDAPDGATSPPTVRVTDGRMKVLGIVSTPSPCYEIGAGLERGGHTLAIEIVAQDQHVVCIGVLSAFAYRVEVADLAPGDYRVTVTYRYPETGWPTTTALDETVTVP
jgi:hypothetical protein